MPTSIFLQVGESGPKRYSCQLWLDWHEIDIGLVRRNIFWLTWNNNYGYGENASGRLKSANSSSKLSDKEWQIRNFTSDPVICIRDQTDWYRSSSRRESQAQSITIVSYDRQRQPFGTIAQMKLKVTNLVQMRLISYRPKIGNFHVCGRISVCPFHTYIRFLYVKAGQLKKGKRHFLFVKAGQLKKWKSWHGPAKLKDNKKLNWTSSAKALIKC